MITCNFHSSIWETRRKDLGIGGGGGGGGSGIIWTSSNDRACVKVYSSFVITADSWSMWRKYFSFITVWNVKCIPKFLEPEQEQCRSFFCPKT